MEGGQGPFLSLLSTLAGRLGVDGQEEGEGWVDGGWIWISREKEKEKRAIYYILFRRLVRLHACAQIAE